MGLGWRDTEEGVESKEWSGHLTYCPADLGSRRSGLVFSWVRSDALLLGAGWGKQAVVRPDYNSLRSLEARTLRRQGGALLGKRGTAARAGLGRLD